MIRFRKKKQYKIGLATNRKKEPAFYDNVVEWGGVYHKVGGKRLEVRGTKVENDNFYIFTLASVAKELDRRGMRNCNVLLSVGLPLTRFGAEKQDFIRYLARGKEVAFRFERERYRIRIARVSVFPQCYAAVADRIRTLPERAVIVDIGSWTIDIMPVYQYCTDEPSCATIPQGLIRCMREINEECVRQIGQELDRFHLTIDTLAFGYILPTTGRIRVFHPLETCAARRTYKIRDG